MFGIFFLMIGCGMALAKTPITIKSDRMEVLQNQKIVVFSGNVVAKKANLTIYADRLLVYYDAKDGKREVKKLVAIGHVKIHKDDWIARAGKAVYFKPQEKIVLEDDPQVWQGDNTVKGARIILYLNEDRYVVESKPNKKAEAVIFTD
ncbi:MAG: lipopolysaccharide transport periplasmic protein LptA [Thermodesulfobacteria bacterium]|nr:lipopolysaccharide transport periplasmic protein LptA [Thermodesulfobacteriota bacterium]